MPVPVVVEFIAGTAGIIAGIGKVRAEMESLTAANASAGARMAAAGTAASAGLVAAAGFVAAVSIKMAGDFQSAVVHLTTDAGEAKSNMQMVSDGILGIARQTGIGTKDLVNAMYYIESSGQHGAQALDTLHAAAEGSAVGAADATITADALSTVMAAYGPSAGTATQAMDGMIYAVSQGKTKLEDFSGAMATLLPAGEKLHIPLSELEGALSTMTAQGQDAASGATHLRQTILQLANPTAKAQKEMESLGLNAFDVSNNLGKNGLTGTFDILTKAIADHTEGGAVLVDQLKSAAHDTTAYQQVLANLNPTQQTTIAALADMTGGTKSLQSVLQLTGDQAEKFKETSLGVAGAMKAQGTEVTDMDVIQGTFNQKMKELKQVVETAMIAIGQKLLPVVSAAADKFLQFTSWLGQHKAVLEALAITVGVVLVAAFVTAGLALAGLVAPFLLAMAPFLAVVGVVVELAAGLIYLYNNVAPVRNAIDQFRHTFSGFVADFNADPSKPFWDRVRYAFTNAWHDLSREIPQLARALWEWIVVATPIAVEKVKEWGAALIDWISRTGWPLLKDALVALGHTLAQWVEDAKQPVISKLSEWGGEVMSWLTGTGLPWLTRTLTRLGLELEAWITPRIPGMLGKLAEFGGSIATWIFTDLVPWVGRAAARIGVSMVEGIVQGIWDAAPQILSALTEISSSALSSVGSFLGINSPSLVFAQQIGSPISEGIAHGILGSGHMIDTALTNVTRPQGNLGASFTSGGGPGGTFGASGVGGSGGGSDVHVHFHAPVYGGPQGMQEVAQVVRTELLRTKSRNGMVGLA